MSVGVVVMACREREAYVDELLDRLDAPVLVVWDERRDRWETGRRAIAAYDPAHTHWCVLQDDAIVCRDLVAGLEQAVEVVGDQPLCLYFGHGLNEAHQRINRLAASVTLPTWLEFEGPWWGVGVMFPTSLIAPMLEVADEPYRSPAYDKRLSHALGKMGVTCRYVLPSLVDHRLDGPSMVTGRDQADRHAHHFIGADASALDIDWRSLPTVDGRRRPAQRHRRPPPAPVAQSRVLARRPRPAATHPLSVSAAVMAHPKRASLASGVSEALNGAPVVFDSKGDRWDTGRRAFEACDPAASHAVVIQDDAIVCRDMLEGLIKALEHVPDNPVGLYLGTVRPASAFMGAAVAYAEAAGSSWVVGEGPWWGVGMAIPSHFVGPMLDWCDAQRHIQAYDRRIASYFAHIGVAAWYTLPSLVDHRDEPSLVRRNAPGRRARRFIGDRSPLDIDWSRMPMDDGKPYLTYTGAAGRRFYQCVRCSYYSVARHAIRHHAGQCPGRDAMSGLAQAIG